MQKQLLQTNEKCNRKSYEEYEKVNTKVKHKVKQKWPINI